MVALLSCTSLSVREPAVFGDTEDSADDGVSVPTEGAPELFLDLFFFVGLTVGVDSELDGIGAGADLDGPALKLSIGI